MPNGVIVEHHRELTTFRRLIYVCKLLWRCSNVQILGSYCAFFVSSQNLKRQAWLGPGPLLLFVSNAYAGQVTLAWDAVSAPSLSGYRLYYGQNSGSYSSQLDAGTQTTYTVSGLTDGQTYYFAVTAYDADEESAFSNEVSVTISASGVQLSTNPSTVPTGGTVTATWSEIASPTTTDWLGLYVPGTANTASLIGSM